MATANREGSGVAWQQLSSDCFSHIATQTVRGDHQRVGGGTGVQVLDLSRFEVLKGWAAD